ncbi:hypothetical protein EG028_08155 [Chitinophaga barathri]|uniref:Uncharacterized protein n=1 Tax=Chitinophaga barathri TaxID=1647451 RepID=A0A3N4MJQ6_9BACT|nr:hypothetical protein EG028_08155 [Chitinophaga barathri]
MDLSAPSGERNLTGKYKNELFGILSESLFFLKYNTGGNGNVMYGKSFKMRPIQGKVRMKNAGFVLYLR